MKRRCLLGGIVVAVWLGGALRAADPAPTALPEHVKQYVEDVLKDRERRITEQGQSLKNNRKEQLMARRGQIDAMLPEGSNASTDGKGRPTFNFRREADRRAFLVGHEADAAYLEATLAKVRKRPYRAEVELRDATPESGAIGYLPPPSLQWALRVQSVISADEVVASYETDGTTSHVYVKGMPTSDLLALQTLSVGNPVRVAGTYDFEGSQILRIDVIDLGDHGEAAYMEIQRRIQSLRDEASLNYRSPQP
jgi:hypothetical protein